MSCTFCIVCLSFECDFDKRCDECRNVSDDVKHQRTLKTMPRSEHKIKSEVSVSKTYAGEGELSLGMNAVLDNQPVNLCSMWHAYNAPCYFLLQETRVTETIHLGALVSTLTEVHVT